MSRCAQRPTRSRDRRPSRRRQVRRARDRGQQPRRGPRRTARRCRQPQGPVPDAGSVVRGHGRVRRAAPGRHVRLLQELVQGEQCHQVRVRR